MQIVRPCNREMEPLQALERAAPGLTVVDVQMIGAAGRVYISGNLKDVTTARDRITEVLAGIEGREH